MMLTVSEPVLYYTPSPPPTPPHPATSQWHPADAMNTCEPGPCFVTGVAFLGR